MVDDVVQKNTESTKKILWRFINWILVAFLREPLALISSKKCNAHFQNQKALYPRASVIPAEAGIQANVDF